MDEEESVVVFMVERNKRRCYRLGCGKSYENRSDYGSVRLTIDTVPWQDIQYHLCLECTEAANTLLENWCAKGVTP